MSDRRAVSAGRLGASSVAVANEPWRVAIGGNRVQSMTVDQIARAYRAGQLSVRTPLWPPGASGWQALGNFEQFQAAPGYDGNPPQLTQFEEADDAPTRMWTGSSDLSELEMSPAALGAAAPALPVEPMAAQPPPRPSARTGTRPVAGRALSAAAQPVRNSSTMPGLATTRAGAPARSSGLWLVAGLVGLVALGSAVLAVRGSWSTTASARASTPDVSADSNARPVAANGDAKRDSASAAPRGAEVNQAQLAKYEDAPAGSNLAAAQAKAAETAPPAAKVEAKTEPATAPSSKAAPEPVAPETPRASRHSSRAESARAARRERLARHEREREASSEARAAEVRTNAEKSNQAKASEPKLSSTAASKRDNSSAVELPKSKSSKNEAKADAKADSQPVSATVNDAAATALTNASKLAASCRPPGGPAGEGKARVIYSQDGDVQSVEILTAKFRDTLTGSCVRMVFRRAKIPPFRGEPPTFIKSFKIPEE